MATVLYHIIDIDFDGGDADPVVRTCRGPNASNPARGRTLPGQERPSNGRPDAFQRRPGSMLCPVGLPGALSVDILALLLYWPTYAPITVRLTSDTHVAYWQWRPELPLNVWATCRCSLNWRQCVGHVAWVVNAKISLLFTKMSADLTG